MDHSKRPSAMDDLRLPFKLRWPGEPMPDISEFAEPLVISFKFRSANPGPNENPLDPGDSNYPAIGRHHQPDPVLSTGERDVYAFVRNDPINRT